MPFNINATVMRYVTELSIILPQIIEDTLSHIIILNLNTNSNLIHYDVISTSEDSE